MTVIGLTGNIGSGKSTAARILTEYGCKHIDADEIGRIVAEPGTPGNAALQLAFGPEYFDADGNLRRKKLGAVVFNDEEKLARLNSILHPVIKAELERRIGAYLAADPQTVIVLEAAILIEAGFDPLIDEIWLVAADDDIRIKRVMARDGISEEAVRDRLRRQMPQEEKARYADRVIRNDRDEAALRQELAAAWQAFSAQRQ